MKAKKVRSGPVYIEREHSTVSLVFEAKVREETGAIIGKPDVYVIDDVGVRLVRHTSRLRRALLVGLLAYVLLWAVSRLLRADR